MERHIQDQLARLFADVRVVLAEHGVTETGLQAAGKLLAEVARERWVREVELAPKHGGASESRVLRTDGPEELTLTLARFKEERATSVHDQGSGVVAAVVDGQDRYERGHAPAPVVVDDGEDDGKARLR